LRFPPGQLRRGAGATCQGAFFGIAVVLATHIVPPERSGRAPAQLLAGVTTVNVRGVTVALSLYKSAISPPQT
jgi:predicted MFS family arabinose efflux permease